jgi:hypothetical protein
MVASRTQGKVGPKKAGQFIPDMGWDPIDLRAFEHLMLNDLAVARKYAAERNRTAFTASLAMLTRAEDALRWQWRYLESARKRNVLEALQIKLSSRNFTEACRAIGLNRNTANRRVETTLLIIATGLILIECRPASTLRLTINDQGCRQRPLFHSPACPRVQGPKRYSPAS